ncbi:MAG: hypothetical protein WC364_15305 [Eubacteriales bacterium]
MKSPDKRKTPLIEFGDVLILSGSALIAAGIWQIYQPAAFIFVGLGLSFAGILSIRRVK